MKHVAVKSKSGQSVKGWKFGYGKAILLVSGHKARHVAGWTLRDPSGYERFVEGNYQQFVPVANRILDNYGCHPAFS